MKRTSTGSSGTGAGTVTGNTSGTTGVSVKQESVDTLVPGYVDSTTFVSSPAASTVRQAPQSTSAQSQTAQATDECERAALPSKSARCH